MSQDHIELGKAIARAIIDDHIGQPLDLVTELAQRFANQYASIRAMYEEIDVHVAAVANLKAANEQLTDGCEYLDKLVDENERLQELLDESDSHHENEYPLHFEYSRLITDVIETSVPLGPLAQAWGQGVDRVVMADAPLADATSVLTAVLPYPELPEITTKPGAITWLGDADDEDLGDWGASILEMEAARANKYALLGAQAEASVQINNVDIAQEILDLPWLGSRSAPGLPFLAIATSRWWAEQDDT